MDLLMDPAVARFLSVLVLVLASLSVWFLFLCCSGRDRDPSSGWDRRRIETKRPLKTKLQCQKTKKSKVRNSIVLPDGTKEVRAPPTGQKSSCTLKKRTKPLEKISAKVTSPLGQKEVADSQQDADREHNSSAEVHT
ncbi:hypothetical protein AAFF_G00164120 [Aldrovandia affinis]|uniref:Uncharacterized protein n=1 Tax=Aldrovandia affinis TaxID=143900 RepID=A0AAD7SZG6_9TELE|nr:hypothetical protein AAFF_G00164120 [Aldrovandia affinis]